MVYIYIFKYDGIILEYTKYHVSNVDNVNRKSGYVRKDIFERRG